jgi:hypothetical protein
MESRDTRGIRNKKQGMLNYNIKFSESHNEDQNQQQNKESDI